MVSALVVGLVAQALAGTAAGQIRHHVLRGPLETVDTAGGLAVGAIFGIALVWLAAVVAVQQPVLGLRNDVQDSEILPVLLKAVPASTVLSALAQFDPLPVIPSLADRSLPPPTPGAVPARLAKQSVVKVEGEACGLVVQGSGWVIEKNLVVTNAHVVAGERDTKVYWGKFQATARVVGISADDDIAVLRVQGMHLRPLPLAAHDPSGGNVGLVGYPENGPLTVRPGRAGNPVTVITPNAYGSHVHARAVVPLRGNLKHGDSGGPVDQHLRQGGGHDVCRRHPGRGRLRRPAERHPRAGRKRDVAHGQHRQLHQLTAASTPASDPIASMLWPSRNTSECLSATRMPPASGSNPLWPLSGFTHTTRWAARAMRAISVSS